MTATTTVLDTVGVVLFEATVTWQLMTRRPRSTRAATRFGRCGVMWMLGGSAMAMSGSV